MRKSILWKLLVVAQVVLFPTMIFASKPPDDAQKTKIMKKTYRIQVPFIENKGQIENKNVSFYARTFGGTLFVEKDGTLTYNLPFADKRGVVIKEIFTEKRIRVKGLNPSLTKINHFKGNDKNNWRSNIPSYNSISLGEIDKGINLTLKVYGNNVEKLFTVLPGRNPEKIKVTLKGAKELKINENGELEVITKLGPVKFTKPLAYQKIGDEKKLVEIAYHITSRITYGFKMGTYDQKRPLIIDPLLASTFIGGSEKSFPWSMALDDSGNVYVSGYTRSSDYPTTPDAYDESHNGVDDVIVAKLDSTLSSLLASTFIGGGDVDQGHCMTLDGSGNVYITGYTYSSDYPTTPGAHDESYNGERDVFVTKLNSSLSSLLASTFIGGSSFSTGRSIALDGSGNVYITGFTSSSDYPTTPGAYDESHNGGDDVFVSKLDSSLSSLLASTFIGGALYDGSNSIAIDGTGNIYITGGAISSNYPTTPGAYDESHKGGTMESYVSKLDSSLSSLLASTFIGGGSYGFRIALDGSGNVYIAGDTASPDFPTTPGAYDEIHNDVWDGYVSKLDSSLSSLLASTFIDSNSEHNSRSMVLDGSGNVYLAGMTSSADYYTTPGAYDKDYHGGWFDVFVTRLDSTLSSFQASTLIGGSEWDGAITISLDGSGNVYVAGLTESSEYPITSGAYDESYNGGIDLFVLKFDSDLSSDYCLTEEIYDEYSEETKMLRGFRDDVLSKTSEGQEIIKLYYEWSPVIVKAMEEDKKFRKEMKSIIDEFLSMINLLF